MGINLDHILGSQQRFYLKTETTKGTTIRPLAADALKVISSAFPFTSPRVGRDDANDGLSDYEMVSDKGEFPVQFQRYVTPSGAAGTEADEGPAVAAVLGVAVEDPGVSWTYSPDDAQSLPAFSAWRLFNGATPIYMDHVFGLILNDLKLSVPGNSRPMWDFSGKGMGHVGTGYALTTNAGAPGTTPQFASPDGRNFEVGSVVQIDATNNGGIGFGVTAVTDTQITVPSATWGIGDIVQPFAPTPAVAGSPIGHTVGSLTIDAVAWPIKSLEATWSKNLDYIEDEFGAAAMTDAGRGKMVASGRIVVRARRDRIIENIRRKLFEQRAIVLTMGSGAGLTCVVNFPQVELVVGNSSIGQNGVAETEIAFLALDSAEGAADSYSVVY